MELPNLSVPLIQGFIICLARVAAIFSAIPVFNGAQIPPQLRIGSVFMFTLLTYPLVKDNFPVETLTVLDLGLLIAAEVIFGALVGFLAQLIIMAAEFAGSVIGYQMGFAAANVFDPATQQQAPLISRFQSIFAILLFLVFNVHYLFLEALVASFDLLPPGQILISEELMTFLVGLFNHAMVLSVRLVAPILVLLILSSLTLGIMSRIFPQLNAFLLSFPLNIGISFIVMGISLGAFVSILRGEFFQLTERILNLIGIMQVFVL